jgi:hypothetical protein
MPGIVDLAQRNQVLESGLLVLSGVVTIRIPPLGCLAQRLRDAVVGTARDDPRQGNHVGSIVETCLAKRDQRANWSRGGVARRRQAIGSGTSREQALPSLRLFRPGLR